MTRYLATAIAALPLALTACTTAQIKTAQGYQDQIVGACTVAMAMPLGPLAPWVIGGCATEAAVAKLALDPTSLEWLARIVAMAKGLRVI